MYALNQGAPSPRCGSCTHSPLAGWPAPLTPPLPMLPGPAAPQASGVPKLAPRSLMRMLEMLERQQHAVHPPHPTVPTVTCARRRSRRTGLLSPRHGGLEGQARSEYSASTHEVGTENPRGR